jgi:hypothetical protein
MLSCVLAGQQGAIGAVISTSALSIEAERLCLSYYRARMTQQGLLSTATVAWDRQNWSRGGDDLGNRSVQLQGTLLPRFFPWLSTGTLLEIASRVRSLHAVPEGPGGDPHSGQPLFGNKATVLTFG